MFLPILKFGYGSFSVLVLLLTFFETTAISQLDGGDHCFCKLKGQIGDCSCNVDTVDHFNNVKIYPRLSSLLNKDYFRFYKVNLNKECPFWPDDNRCAMRYCHVMPCQQDKIPEGLKQTGSNHQREEMTSKYLKSTNEVGDDCNHPLGDLNTTISDSVMEEFALWQAHDDLKDSYCLADDESSNGTIYVDLLLNPERYTGYKGQSAHRIWHSIYMENCFRPKDTVMGKIASSHLNGMCLEKRVFYRVVSGLHTSINIHLCANYLFPGRDDFMGVANMLKTYPDKGSGSNSGSVSIASGEWGPNLEEFKRRFSPETTSGEGTTWLKNLYFLYLLELRAMAKAAPYLLKELYYTGNMEEDKDTRAAVKDLLSVAKSFKEHFNESSMFSGGKQAAKLKEEFRLHFRNISAIMDCVGCEKCKLWGKLQIQGLGTALKILFSGKFDKFDNVDGVLYSGASRKPFFLQRSEVVALFNSLGRLSSSIYHIETFRQMMR